MVWRAKKERRAPFRPIGRAVRRGICLREAGLLVTGGNRRASRKGGDRAAASPWLSFWKGSQSQWLSFWKGSQSQRQVERE